MDGVGLVSHFTLRRRTMSLSTDASKVLALLAELKSGLQHKDKNIDSDVETLERVLRDPLFCAQLSEQDKTRSLNVAADSAQLGEAANNLLVDELKQHLRLRQADRVVEEVRREVEAKVAEFAAVDRPLAFCALDIDASNPEPDLVLVEAGEGANRRIVVVGPRDLPDRPSAAFLLLYDVASARPPLSSSSSLAALEWTTASTPLLSTPLRRSGARRN
uniref:L27 domain-containing protein n=1 Tax=Plectus sambesii TaxID=2011161 RepID=A0A914WNQ6_9BILA